jgi:hypothetical protein
MKEMLGEQGKIHVVMNSLSGDHKSHSIDLLVEEGRFVEIGKRGIWSEDTASGRLVRLGVRQLGLLS